MSNNKLILSYAETNLALNIPQSWMSQDCNDFFSHYGGNDGGFWDAIYLRQRALNPGGSFAWAINTFYGSFSQALKCDLFRINHGNSASEMRADVSIPVRGAKITTDSEFPGGLGNIYQNGGLIAHEMGHSFGFTDEYLNLLMDCPDGKPSAVGLGALFSGVGCTRAGVFYRAMGYSPAPWYSPLQRASLGWLEPSQVKTVVKSGIFEVCAESDDLSSSPKKPLLLQARVEVNGLTDFIYLSTFSSALSAYLSDSVAPEYLQHLQNSILLSAGGGLVNEPYSRRGLSRVANTEHTYAYPRSDADSNYHKHTLAQNEKVRMSWPGTSLSLKLIKKSGDCAQVDIQYVVNTLPTSPVQPSPLP